MVDRNTQFKIDESQLPPWTSSSHPSILTQTVDPSWSFKSGQNGTPWPAVGEVPFVEVDPKDREKRDIYKMLISSVNPRPIAFISTMNKKGEINVAPFSFFNLVSPDPPTVFISFTHDNPPTRKETCRNILETGEFVVNIISEAFVEASNACAIGSPAGVSEFEISGLHPIPSTVVKPPRVGESAFSMECRLVHQYDIISEKTGLNSSTAIFGQIVRFHVRSDILESPPASSTTSSLDSHAKAGDLKIAEEKLRPVARLGGIRYSRLGERFDLVRPTWGEFEEFENGEK
ncbi:hypothetical protein T439DRAFT_330425 [Meredithblackwellia eburnea MCA 4105]